MNEFAENTDGIRIDTGPVYIDRKRLIEMFKKHGKIVLIDKSDDVWEELLKEIEPKN